MSLPSLLLATAGTSLLRHASGRSTEELKASLVAERWHLPEAGVELNSLALLLRGHVDPDAQVHYFLSDTEDGARVGEVLRAVVGEQRVVLHPVKNLNPAMPELFARRGLANLASEMGRVLRGVSSDQCAIDATGGFKAQSGVAITLGHALQIPVYYRHESFADILTIPPLPIALDAGLWCQEAALFFELAEDVGVMNQLPQSPRLQNLLSWQIQDDVYVVGLNATGTVFHEAMCHQWPSLARLQLPAPALQNNLELSLLPPHLQSLLRSAPYVVEVRPARLAGAKEGFFLRGTRLYLCCRHDRKRRVFRIRTTARGHIHRLACLADLLLRWYSLPK